ncbi:hypothetical protein XELAEV_18031685mg [Xenopus laevis]|uniref:Uncharacterized protein n=1 Tax=Xenopus laevis TaxID=8355 RepID=A0A974CP84_XENLA|nr:hypothetical protein XELAEV_18031685mg [Xenopus laevis]
MKRTFRPLLTTSKLERDSLAETRTATCPTKYLQSSFMNNLWPSPSYQPRCPTPRTRWPGATSVWSTSRDSPPRPPTAPTQGCKACHCSAWSTHTTE